MNAVSSVPTPKPHSRISRLPGLADTPADPRGARAADALAARDAQVPPLKPAEYLQLRRKAAGLSVEDVATILAPNERDRKLAAEAIRMWETPGVVVKTANGLHALRRAFPFDPGVYRQLAEAPADRHPLICRACGCSVWDRCSAGDQEPACAWASADRCTCCVTGSATDAR